MPRTIALFTAALLSSCSQFNVLPIEDGGAVSGGGQPGAMGAGGQSGGMTISGSLDAPVAGAGGGAEPTDPGCPSGSHQCAGGGCVDSRSPDHCGLSCSPCPTIAGGTVTCDGTKCGAVCPPGTKVCLDKCVPESDPCDGKCPPSTNPCSGGLCVDARSLSACGTACMPCPTSANGVASCNGDTCDLKCNSGYHRCGDACVANTDPATCGSSCTACETPKGGKATCDGNKCGGECPAGTKLCAGACIPSAQSCNGQCAAGKHDCNGNCVSDTDTSNCGTGCLPCDPPPDADATCDGKSCGFKCRSGFHQCGQQCKSSMSIDSCGSGCEQRCTAPNGATPTCNGTSCDFHCDSGRRCHDQCIGDDQPCDNLCVSGRTLCSGKCIPSGQCCTDRDCPKCQECTGGSCRDEAAGQDKKNECAGALGCNGGKCQACSPGAKKCADANTLETCNSAGTDTSTTNCPDGCANNSCVKAVSLGKKCTSGGAPCENGGNCVDGFCCSAGVTACGVNDSLGRHGDCFRCGSSGQCDVPLSAGVSHGLCNGGNACDGFGGCAVRCVNNVCPNDPTQGCKDGLCF